MQLGAALFTYHDEVIGTSNSTLHYPANALGVTSLIELDTLYMNRGLSMLIKGVECGVCLASAS